MTIRAHHFNRYLVPVLVGILVLFSVPVTAATITVGPSDCNYTNIQEAIDNATAGDTILVTAATYDEALDVTRSLTIRGVNGTPAVGKADVDASVRISANDVILENIRITTGAKWDIFAGGDNLSLRDLNMTGHDPADSHDPVIVAYSVAGLSIDGCIIDTNGAFGIQTTNVGDFVLRDSQIRTRNIAGETAGVGCSALFNLDYISFSGPVITNTTFVGGSIEVTCPAEVHGITIQGNTVSDIEADGIVVSGDMKDGFHSKLTNVTVEGNCVRDSHGGRFTNFFVEYCTNGRIEDNLVEDSYDGKPGIYLRTLDNFLIQGNTVRNATFNEQEGTTAMYLEEITNSIVSGNTLTHVDPYGFRYAPGPNYLPNLTFDTTNTHDGRPVRYYEAVDGVSLDGEEIAMLVLMSSSDIEVTDCTIANTGLGAGIYGCSDLSFSGNTFRKTNNGMMLISSSDTVVRDNTFNGSFWGMGFGDNTDTLITGNTFTGYMDTGVLFHCQAPEGVTISENRFEGSLIGEQAVVGNQASGHGMELVNNTITGNTRGIFLSDVQKMTFRNNNLTDNGVGLNMMGASENVFLNNTIISDEEYAAGIIIANAEQIGGGPCWDNLFSNNYIESDEPLNVTYIIKPSVDTYEFGPIWGQDINFSVAESEGDCHNDWNVTETNGTNIVGGPSLGGNYWATPDGTGWSQVTPDRGDGFCTAPFAYDGNNTDYLPLHLYVDPTPVANFTLTPQAGVAPLAVMFTDTSTGNITNWSWTFGDGETSTLQHPVHTYTMYGLYSVTLNVTGPAGVSELTRAGAVTVRSAAGDNDDGGSAPVVATGTGLLNTNSRGLVIQDLKVSAGDGTGDIEVPAGSVALDADGDPLADVTISPSTLPSAGSGSGFSFAGYAYTCGPAGATFAPAADLVFAFTEAEWAELVADGRPLVVTYYNEETGLYEELSTTVDATSRTVTAKVTHFSSFVLMFGAEAVVATPVATPLPTPPTVTPTVAPAAPDVESTPAPAATATPEATPFPVAGMLGGVLAALVCVGRRR